MKSQIDTPEIPFEIGDDIPNAFRKIAVDRPDDVALVFKERRITWNQLSEKVCRIANALLAKGTKKGDRIAILSKNSVEYVELILGALTAGACFVPLPTMFSFEALGLMVEDSVAKLIDSWVGSACMWLGRLYADLKEYSKSEQYWNQVVALHENAGTFQSASNYSRCASKMAKFYSSGKSGNMLDEMIGLHNKTNLPMNKALCAN